MGQNSIKTTPFFFIVVVWGDEYVDLLLRVSLRCFLSPKNIPSLTTKSISKFIFVTTAKDYLKISQAAIFKKLATYIKPVFVELEFDQDETIYINMTKGYEAATQLAYKDKAYAIYLLPDCVISDGAFLSLEKYARAGRDVVLLPGPRIIKEKFLSYINEDMLVGNDHLCFAARELAALGLRFLHEEFKNYQYTGRGFTKWPHMVTWDIPDQNGLLIRAFHLHPLMVNCSNLQQSLSFYKSDTIDANFIKRNFIDLNRFILERDSDNIILYSLTNEKDRLEHGLLWNMKEKLKAILEISQSDLVNELQKIYFYNAYKLHDSELVEAWDRVEQESLAVVSAVLMPKYLNRKNNSLYRKLCSRLLAILPVKLSYLLKQFYWQTCGWFSWCKLKLRPRFFIKGKNGIN